jgi:hypothetical protein
VRAARLREIADQCDLTALPDRRFIEDVANRPGFPGSLRNDAGPPRVTDDCGERLMIVRDRTAIAQAC